MYHFERLAETLHLTPSEAAQRFEQLPEREREILILRFGLNDGVVLTLEETADAFNVTRERVRQIENKAMAMLRHFNH